MIVALDLETTGLDSGKDRIIEIALVKIDEKTFKTLDTYTTLINPEVEIPELITNITNITNGDVIDSPTFSQKLWEISNFIGDSPILGHNTRFDSGFLRANGIELKNNIELDTFDLANFLLPEEKSLSLESLSESLGLGLKSAHRALADTIATVELFKILVKRLKKVPTNNLKFFDYVSRKSEIKSFSFIYTDILGIKSQNITDEELIKLLIKSLKLDYKDLTRKNNATKDLGNFEDFVKNNTSLELRENQMKMASYVSKSFEEGSLNAIEAPTGVGKTFAYLLPSILHSLKSGEQVHVSTSTKALQDQIFFKDLEFLYKNLGEGFSFCKLKGKRNYIGIAAFVNFIEGFNTFSKEESSFILKILFWLGKTKHGELDELDYFGKEFLFLHEINADDLLTFSNENSYEKYEFAVNARRIAKKTNIVVINNNILFQDIDGENKILGKIDNLILDEAHTLEDVVTSSLQKSFGLIDFEKTLIQCEKVLRKNNHSLDGFSNKVDILLFEIGIVFDFFQLYLNKKTKTSDKYRNILLGQDFYGDNIDIKEVSVNIQLKITEFLDSFSVVPDKIYLSLSREIQKMESYLEIIKIILDNTDKNRYIKLVDFNERRGYLTIGYTLLNPGEYLKKNLWSKISMCTLTSATLKIGSNFDYITKMLSLDGFSFQELESDFDYSKQALLFIPEDLGSVKNNTPELIDFLKKFLLIVQGNTLLLFTAFYTIKEVYNGLLPPLKEKGIHVYAQSIGGGKHKLVEAFKKRADHSILIGTDTFWEGIDIAGDDLKYLVIHKVPFMVPTDPIFQARSGLFSNGFQEYGIPKSILKLKQGFGRLIRSKSDNGVIVFLDDRIYSTTWGEVFYSAFPETIRIRKGKSDDFLKILQENKRV